MPTGIYPIEKRKGLFKKGEHPSIKTEFQKGKHYSLKTEFKKGQISSMKGKHPTAWNKDKKMSEEYKNKVRIGILKAYKERPEIIEKIRQARLRQIYPTKDTSIEIKIQNLLKELGIQFEKHKLLLNKYRVDLFIEPNKIIECDGGYWHNLTRTKAIDGFKDFLLNDTGYRILRLSEWDINNRVDFCKQKILRFINNKGLVYLSVI